MLNIGVLFGAKSVEHDISVLTALEAMGHLDEEKYNVYPVYMAKDGFWYTGEALRSLSAFSGDFLKAKGVTRVAILPGSRELWQVKGKRLARLCELDAALLCNHGAYGEDGCVQGLLELADVPYTSCGVAASALGMDKHYMKAQFERMGLRALPHLLFASGRDNPVKQVSYPAVVKPATLGSSIGISFVRNPAELEKALEVAFLYDPRAVVEPALTDFREINCAALSDGETLFVSECEEPKTSGSILSFSDKYLTGDKLTGQAAAEREFPAKISKELKTEIQEATRAVYRGFEARGVIRVDYMLKDGEVYVNEVNTIPGALANYLFEFKYNKLLDKLIRGAIAEQKKREGLIRNFSSSVITGVTAGKITCLKS